MKSVLLAVALPIVFLAQAVAAPAGYVLLYNGKDLSGWQTTGNWLPQENGVLLIHPRPGEEGWQRYSDYLWTQKKYKDFMRKGREATKHFILPFAGWATM